MNQEYSQCIFKKRFTSPLRGCYSSPGNVTVTFLNVSVVQQRVLAAIPVTTADGKGAWVHFEANR